MISKVKLNKGFINNDQGELRCLFLNAAKNHGFCTKWFEGKEDKLFGTYLFIDEEGVVNGNSELERVYNLGRKKLTVKDFYIEDEEEPQQTQEAEAEHTSVKYVPVKCGVLDIASLKDDFEARLLYKKVDRIYGEDLLECVTDYETLWEGLIGDNLHRKTVTNWYDNLNGTEENGVWCWVWDDNKHTSVGFVESKCDMFDVYVCRNNISWRNAKPMSKQALVEMLKIMKENV